VYRYYNFFKRLIDYSISLFLLILFIPFILVIILAIKLTSRGSVSYHQERVGLNGKVFRLYKFRTMIQDAEKDTGPILSKVNDVRVTGLGRIMRRLRIDEIPQLVNVLKGDMSLVGPRPERPYFVNKHEALQGLRLSVRPGLTGLAQVEGYYHTAPRNKLRYDKIYIENKSLTLDIKIMLKTLIVIITKKGS
jgi:lipopolysaccharide/colanic/teichoic acid biosynthesis glycosyltransferase